MCNEESCIKQIGGTDDMYKSKIDDSPTGPTVARLLNWKGWNDALTEVECWAEQMCFLAVMRMRKSVAHCWNQWVDVGDHSPLSHAVEPVVNKTYCEVNESRPYANSADEFVQCANGKIRSNEWQRVRCAQRCNLTESYLICCSLNKSAIQWTLTTTRSMTAIHDF